jgi:endonuclease-3
MRTSRVSKDAAKLFGNAAEPSSPPRRVTRSALARFSYASNTTTKSSTAVDIEDIAGPPTKRRKKESPELPATLIKTEVTDEYRISAPSAPSSTPRKARKPARKTKDESGEIKVEPPSDWEAMYDAVKQMRAPGGPAYGAAVDTMGCERLADRTASPKDQRFHTLVSLMLSSQTKDTVNAVAMKRLQTEMPPYKPGAPVGLNLDNMLAVDPKLLNEMIWAVGFHNNKTKYACLPAALLLSYGSDSSRITNDH